MGTSRRQFFQVTAGGLVTASGLAGRVRPVRAQGPTVKIGSAVLGDYSMVTPILVALEKGYFRAQGVTVEFQPLRGGPDLVKAVVAGQFQIGTSGATDVPVFRATGVPIRFIASRRRREPLHPQRRPDDRQARGPQREVDRGDARGRDHLGVRHDAGHAAGLGAGEGSHRRRPGRPGRPAGGARPRGDRRLRVGRWRCGHRASGQVEDPGPAGHGDPEVAQPGILRDRRLHQGQQGRDPADAQGSLPGRALHAREHRRRRQRSPPRPSSGRRRPSSEPTRSRARSSRRTGRSTSMRSRPCRRRSSSTRPRTSACRRPTYTRRSSRRSGSSRAALRSAGGWRRPRRYTLTPALM